MRTGSRFVVLCVCVLAMASSLKADMPGEQLAGLVSGNTLGEFITTVEKEGLSAPSIPSQWRLERLEPNEQALGEEARAFGSMLLQLIDDFTALKEHTNEAEECARQADILLRTATWVGGTEGYGNAILASRALDAATVPAGRLLVAAEGNATNALALISRLNTPWNTPAVRARILDGELGEKLFECKDEKNITADDLAKIWTLGMWRRSLREGSLPPGVQLASISLRMVAPKALDRHLDFFVESAVRGSHTTRERWNAKGHDSLVNGLESSNVRLLRKLARFRELVGGFPESAPYKNHPFSCDQEAAFEYAWRPFRDAEGPIYGEAWIAYRSIVNGEFADQDTAILRLRKRVGDSQGKQEKAGDSP